MGKNFSAAAAATVVVLSILLWPSFLQGQFAIRMNVALVSVDVSVTDSAGRPVTNLTEDDFLIYEDGQRQNLQTFGSADSPYDLILLFDCSDSTSNQWPLLDEAVAGFLKFRKPQDRTLVAAFGDRIQITRNWNSRRQNRLDRALVCGGSQFYVTLNWAIQRFNGVKARKGVVMLTDAVDSFIPMATVDIAGRKAIQFKDLAADRDFQKALRLVGKSGIPFYFVAVGTDLNPSIEIPAEIPDLEMANLRQMRSRMEQLAEASGGSVVFPKRPEDVIPMYEQIGIQLGTSYSLGYAPPNINPDGKRHKIEIRLRPPNLRLKQSRDGYTAK